MKLSASSMPANRWRTLGASSAGAAVRAVHVQPDAVLGGTASAIPARSSTRPALVVPAVATTAKTSARRLGPATSASAAPVSRPRASPGTCEDPDVHHARRWTDRGVGVGGAGQRPAARRDGVEPVLEAPLLRGVPGRDERRQVADRAAGDEAAAGRRRPARAARRASASTSFSAWIAPAPPSQSPAKTFDALVASSKAAAERVGADGMYARFIGSSCGAVAGTRTSVKRREGTLGADPGRRDRRSQHLAELGGRAGPACGSVGCPTRWPAQSRTARTPADSSPQTEAGGEAGVEVMGARMTAHRAVWSSPLPTTGQPVQRGRIAGACPGRRTARSSGQPVRLTSRRTSGGDGSRRGRGAPGLLDHPGLGGAADPGPPLTIS